MMKGVYFDIYRGRGVFFMLQVPYTLQLRPCIHSIVGPGRFGGVTGFFFFTLAFLLFLAPAGPIF